ncbi:MAG: TatD family hydrolase [Sphingobacteriaceae bacterium]|nr:TatD family hydrolase [Sphingobacteriaceae bacterium]
MQLTDTHTHLYYELEADKQAVLMENCFENNVNRLFLPNVNVETIALIDGMVAKYPQNCFAMLGLHPCEVKEDYEKQLNQIYKAISNRKIYAVGEIGIDLYWDKSTLENQIKAFKTQINWAKELDLPIVIHCREAFDEIFSVLEEVKHEKLRGILHCFSGNLQQAKKAVDFGLHLGIGGVVTYKKVELANFLAQIPIENIVLETDSPYLAPMPFRGKPNQSSYLIYIAEKLADIYQISVEQVAEITTHNSKIIFQI